jgi:hypothetical protein
VSPALTPGCVRAGVSNSLIFVEATNMRLLFQPKAVTGNALEPARRLAAWKEGARLGNLVKMDPYHRLLGRSSLFD